MKTAPDTGADAVDEAEFADMMRAVAESAMATEADGAA